MPPRQKIATAKRLMVEATRELTHAHDAAIAAEVCACQHRRDRHTMSHSINYTGGFCMVRGCKCKNYMQGWSAPQSLPPFNDAGGRGSDR